MSVGVHWSSRTQLVSIRWTWNGAQDTKNVTTTATNGAMKVNSKRDRKTHEQNNNIVAYTASPLIQPYSSYNKLLQID